MSEEVSEVLEQTNLSEYYDTLNIYYADKLKLSLKKKFNSCPGCKGKREFIVKKDELIYSCGSNKGECGPQITIKLADYLDYELLKKDISQFKKRTPSLDKVKDLINVQKEIERYNDFNDKTKDLLKNTTKSYIKSNDLKKRGKEIEKYNEEKIKILTEMNKLKSKMNDPNDSNDPNDPNEPKKKEYKQKYISLSSELNELYINLRSITDKRITKKIMMNEPQIKKSSSKYEEKEVKKKKKKEK